MSKPINDAGYTTDTLPIRGSKIPQQPASGAMHNIDADTLNQLRNHALPRGGLVFTGKSGNICLLPTNVTQFGTTGPFSFSLGGNFRISQAAGQSGFRPLVGQDDGGSNRKWSFYFGNTSQIYLDLWDSTNTMKEWRWNYTANNDDILVLSVDTVNHTVVLYLNGIALTAATTPGSWDGSIASVSLAPRIAGNGNSGSFTARSFGFYNLTLSAADAADIFFMGGAVPARFQYGSATNLIVANGTQADSDFSSSSTNWSIISGAAALDSNTTVAGKLYVQLGNASSLSRVGLSTISWTGNKVYFFSLKARLRSGTAVPLTIGRANFSANSVPFTPTGTEQTFTGYLRMDAAQSPLHLYNANQIDDNGSSYEFDAVVVQQVGAVFYLGLDDGRGSTAYDFSPNGLNGAITSADWFRPVTYAGTQTTDNAPSGILGEIISSAVAVGSAVSLSNNTPANVTSISLTAGDWDVEGNVNFTESSATVTGRQGCVNSTSATMSSDGTEVYCGTVTTTTSETNSTTLPRKRISIAATTTVYLVAKAGFSAGTVTAFGSITARRVR